MSQVQCAIIVTNINAPNAPIGLLANPKNAIMHTPIGVAALITARTVHKENLAMHLGIAMPV